MTQEFFDASLRGLVGRRPFRPFIVEFDNGSTITVTHPEALVFRSGRGVYLAPDGEVNILDHEGVTRFIDRNSTAAA